MTDLPELHLVLERAKQLVLDQVRAYDFKAQAWAKVGGQIVAAEVLGYRRYRTLIRYLDENSRMHYRHVWNFRITKPVA